ncbi:MAG TPA: branched-chain amino acid ABC transporter permease [Kiloniellales bacterium]|jgi:branched-chain amino acid transport system permease protein|nr:branched-chain amino acid ABC transporter permease [Kiloniellales bacterium]
MPRRHLLLAAAVVALLALLPLSGSTYLLYLFTQVLIFVLFATSLNLLIGYAGLVSFGHAAFFAIGGYGCAILLRSYGVPLLLAMPAALVMTAVFATLIGALCVRLTSYYFSMLTLAFGQLVWAVVFKWRSMTGGDDGFLRIVSPSWIDTPASFFLFTLVLVTLAMVALWIVAHSPLGRTLMAIRENQVRAGFLGVHTRRVQLVAFIIAGTFAGLAGALFALFNRSIFPDSAWWLQSAEVLIMVVLGGMNSFFGPAVGALTLILLGRLTLELTAFWPALLAIILIATLFFFPSGIAGLLKARGRR